jgi:hypothetical protein
MAAAMRPNRAPTSTDPPTSSARATIAAKKRTALLVELLAWASALPHIHGGDGCGCDGCARAAGGDEAVVVSKKEWRKSMPSSFILAAGTGGGETGVGVGGGTGGGERAGVEDGAIDAAADVGVGAARGGPAGVRGSSWPS